MFDFLLCLILALASAAIIYVVWKIYWALHYWNRKCADIVPHYLYGNLRPYIRDNLDFGTMLRNYYNRSYGETCVGLYMIYKPALLLRDSNAMRTVFFNNFGSFCSRKVFEEKEKCPLLDNLYQRSEDEWRLKRDLLAKAFSVSNIADLYETIARTSTLEAYLDQLTECALNSISINKIMERHLFNVMAWTIFGVHIETIAYAEDTFRMMGLEAFRTKFVDKLSFVRDLAVPVEWEWAHNLLNFRRHSKRIEDFYISMTKHVLHRREYYAKESNSSKDFMQYLMKIRNRGHLYNNEQAHRIQPQAGAYKYLSETEVASLSFLALTLGLPNMLTTLDFFLFEIAKDEFIQHNLSVEVEEMFEGADGNPDYSDIAKMEYLDCCLNETLRKYPPVTYIMRYCTHDFVLPNEKIKISKGMPVFGSVLGVHHDPLYYPDPMRFDPRRFTKAEVVKRPLISFIPFGFGPRNCVGAALATAILKVTLVFIISKYKVFIASRMQNTEINFDKGYLNEVNRIYLRFGQRMKDSPSEEDD